MNILDFSWRRERGRKNSPLFPQNIRGLIVGKSNCGKTTLLLNLLLRDGWLDYNELKVFGNSLHQAEYQILRQGFERGFSKCQLSNLFKRQDILKSAGITFDEAIEQYDGVKERGIHAEFYDDCSLIPDPKDLDHTRDNLLILDDCFLGNQNKAEAYYTRGRQNNCDTIYISQNYFRLPRHTVRENANLFMLFPQDAKNMNHIYADHCANDMSNEEFRRFCNTVWNDDGDKHNFVTIDLTSGVMNGKYRKNLDCFYISPTETARDIRVE